MRASKPSVVPQFLLASMIALLTLQLPGCCVHCNSQKRLAAMAAARARAAAAPAANARRFGAFNLEPNPDLPEGERVDVNGILRNAVWHEQIEERTAGQPYPFAKPDEPKFKCWDRKGAFTQPECTTQETFCDLPQSLFLVICSLNGKCRIRGHINWVPATYEGAIVWDQLAIDQDDDFLLYPPNQAALTVASCRQRQKALGIEFDSREVVDRLSADDPNFWWSQFRDAMNDPESDQGRALLSELRGKHAILTGLMNLDCEHGCTTELHPLWVMAIHLRDNPTDDVWVLLARNWGDEGFCSSEQHYLDGLPPDPANPALSQFTLRLPWRNQATGVAVNPDKSVFYGSEVAAPQITYVNNQAAFVKFKFPKPDNTRGFSLGELHLIWKNGQTEPVNPVGPIDNECTLPEAARAPAGKPARPPGEELLSKAKNIMNQDKEKVDRYKRTLSQGVVAEAAAKATRQQVGAATAEVAPPLPPSTSPKVRPGPDNVKFNKDVAEVRALCAAFENNIPGLPGVCKKVKGGKP